MTAPRASSRDVRMGSSRSTGRNSGSCRRDQVTTQPTTSTASHPVAAGSRSAPAATAAQPARRMARRPPTPPAVSRRRRAWVSPPAMARPPAGTRLAVDGRPGPARAPSTPLHPRRERGALPRARRSAHRLRPRRGHRWPGVPPARGVERRHPGQASSRTSTAPARTSPVTTMVTVRPWAVVRGMPRSGKSSWRPKV